MPAESPGRRPGAPTRGAEALSGLLAGGLLLLGVAVLVARLMLPHLPVAAGSKRPAGPAVWRGAVLLLAGAAVETAHLLRTRMPAAARAGVAALSVGLALVALALTWWR